MTKSTKQTPTARAPQLSDSFFAGNRRTLQQRFFAEYPEATCAVITGSYLVQASADIAHPFVQDSHFYYLTGLNEPGLQLVLTPDGEFLITPQHDVMRAAFNGVVDEAKLAQYSGIQDVLNGPAGWQRLQELCKQSSEPTVGILEPIDSYIPQLLMFTGISRGFIKQRLSDECGVRSWLDLRKTVSKLRVIKQPEEINMIQAAIDHTSKAFTLLKDAMCSASNERELLAIFTDYKIREDVGFAYDPIIGAGANAVTLHYGANNMPIRKDDLVLMDLGFRVAGYNADITRTWAAGQLLPRKQAVYDAVERLQAAAVAKLKPGVVPADYEKEMETLTGQELVKLGLITEPTRQAIRRYFPHRTSHFLGIDVHDVGEYDQPLQPNMVLTVEPGIYIPEEAIGVRIEDDLLITPTGNTILSKELPR